MSQPAFTKVSAQTAAEICAHFTLDKNARRLLRDGAAPREFVAELVSQQQYTSAIDFMAHALASREAIWWGCLCLQHACGGAFSQQERAALAAAVQWVLQPCEERRIAAKIPGDLLGYGVPAGALAIAANQTGGSLAPSNYQPVPPGAYAPAKAVAIAVKCASLKGDPLKMAERQRCYAELGMALAEGKYV